jgi:hypothetical protein
MSDLTYGWDQAPAAEPVASTGIPWAESPQRSIWQPILLVLPLILAAGGYLFAAAPLVDLSFVTLTALCTIFLFGELGRFAERYGVGGVVLYGGVLIWFCYDYFYLWFLGWIRHWNLPFSEVVVARAAMYHMLYILCMSIGLRIRAGRWLARLITKFPEPPDPSNYFLVVIVTQIIGLLPYLLFTRESFFLAIYHQISGGRTAGGTQWTVGRTGNLNYNFGGYVAELLWVGNGGAIVAAFCLVFLRQNIVKNIFCAFVWLLWLGLNFGTGTRGQVITIMLPIVCFIFVRYHVQAQELLHRYSIRAYVFSAVFLLATVVLFQIQARYRNMGFQEINFSDVSLTKLEGNAMFSTSLVGFQYIPSRHDYFYDNFPGETVVFPIPHFLLWAAIAPMPRAIWTTKWVDPEWVWYSSLVSGRSTLGGGTAEGTTISSGIVGYWFFRFGPPGVIEGGIFMGWLLGIFERALYNNGGRPLAFLAALALLTWMFRTYRDADLQDLADTWVVLGGLAICVLMVRPFLGSRQNSFPT